MGKPLYGLIPLCFPRHKRWAVGVDYHDQLSEDEKKWLDQFNREFHEGAVRRDDRGALHNTVPLRRDCYRRNNAQNRDLYGIKECCGRLDFELYGIGSDGHENRYASRIDAKENAASPLVLLALALLHLYQPYYQAE